MDRHEQASVSVEVLVEVLGRIFVPWQEAHLQTHGHRR